MINLRALAGIALTIWMSVTAAHAVTNTVIVGSYFFNPTNITIKQGDTILWSNTSTVAHDSTQGESNTPPAQRLWASPNLAALVGTYRFTFTNVAFYPYVCLQHISTRPQQTGSVTVVEGNFAPTVNLTLPTAGTRHPSPPNFVASATASDPDGTIDNVFFTATPAGGSAINVGTATTEPYSIRVTTLGPGSYQFRAVAVDNKGLSTTSAPVNVPITVPASLGLSAPVVTAASQFQFDLSTTLGLSYVVEESGNLGGPWSPVSTNTASGATMKITRPFNAPPGQRFYRAFIQP